MPPCWALGVFKAPGERRLGVVLGSLELEVAQQVRALAAFPGAQLLFPVLMLGASDTCTSISNGSPFSSLRCLSA